SSPKAHEDRDERQNWRSRWLHQTENRKADRALKPGRLSRFGMLGAPSSWRLDTPQTCPFSRTASALVKRELSSRSLDRLMIKIQTVRYCWRLQFQPCKLFKFGWAKCISSLFGELANSIRFALSRSAVSI